MAIETYLIILTTLVAMLGGINVYLHQEKKKQQEKCDAALRGLGELENERNSYIAKLEEQAKINEDLSEMLIKEKERSRVILSQKKSSETRTGLVAEQLVPFLENFNHDPKTLRFLGAPIDYVSFNLDEGAIYFIEVKSGNSKPTKRQKTIREIIKAGHVYYEEVRINKKGVKNKVAQND